MPRADSPSTSEGARFEGLDGLRALAIVAVLVFHLHEGWLPGGFLGVDVFFVISGFLITSLLVHEVSSTGRLDAPRFWVRRARRLLPALFIVIAGASLTARMVSSDLVVNLGRQVLGAATFSTNWLEIAAGASYFDGTAPVLFMNFWSLAVEEQFYLVWPVLTVLLVRTVLPRHRAPIALALALASAVAMGALYHPGQDATRVYYGTDTHLMGLMIGAALAFAWAAPQRMRIEDLRDRWGRYATPAAGAVLALLLLLGANDQTFTFRGGMLLACLATGVLLVAAIDRAVDGRRTPLQRVLDAAPVRWLGVRSYGIYLWHWPVILIVGQLVPAAIGTFGFVATRGLAVAITLGLAEASFRYVEMPIRRNGFRATARTIRHRVLSLPRGRRRATLAVVAVLCGAFVVTVVTAPTTSSTAQELKRNETATSDDSAVGAATSGVLTLDPAAAAKGFAMPAGDEIDAFGDSVMVGGVHALEYYLPGIRIDAKSNRRWGDGLEAVQKKGPQTRRAVVLDFGTNAGMDEATMTEILDALGPDRMVVLVNEYGTSRSGADNEVVARVAGGRSNVAIADWHATVTAHPDALQADGIHPSLRGSHYYAATIRQALADLSEQHTGETVPLRDLPMP